MSDRKSKISDYLTNPNIVLGVYIIITLTASVHKLLLGSNAFDYYTHYNNFIVFKQSFFHLIENKDLYLLYPEEQWDYYKYSPTFALLMLPFAIFPSVLGMPLWNLLNAISLFFAVKILPLSNQKIKVFILWFILLELLTSIQNSQSNGLIAALIIFAFNFFEKKNVIMASFFIVLSVYIKIFGIVAFSLFILYPDKIKFILYSILWIVIFALLPLIVVSFEQLQFLYSSWFNLLSEDQTISYGLSVMGWLHSWFGLENFKQLILLIGIIIFCVPLTRFKSFNNIRYKLLFLSSILLWVIIFNHKAESPTFIIAIAGVAIWYFTQERKMENSILVILAFLFTSLSPTDLFPRYLRNEFVVPYVLKVFPCILIWFKIIYELTFNNYKNLADNKTI